MNINVTAGWPAKRSSMVNRVSMAVTFSAAALLALCAASSGSETAKPAFKPMDVFDLQWAADPEVSPDGRNIAYVRMGYDVKTDRARGTVWLVGVDGKNERPLSGAPTSGSPRQRPPAVVPRRHTYRVHRTRRRRLGAALHVLGVERRQRADQQLYRKPQCVGLVAGRPLARLYDVGAAGTKAAESGAAGDAKKRQVGGSPEADRPDGFPG